MHVEIIVKFLTKQLRNNGICIWSLHSYDVVMGDKLNMQSDMGANTKEWRM